MSRRAAAGGGRRGGGEGSESRANLLSKIKFLEDELSRYRSSNYPLANYSHLLTILIILLTDLIPKNRGSFPNWIKCARKRMSKLNSCGRSCMRKESNPTIKSTAGRMRRELFKMKWLILRTRWLSLKLPLKMMSTNFRRRKEHSVSNFMTTFDC